MSARNLILLFVALLVAGSTAYFARGLMTRPPQQVVVQAPAPPPPSSSAILVAAGDLPAGTLLLEEHLKWQPWPENSMGPNYIKQTDADIKSYVGAVVRRGISAGQPIMPSLIVKPGDRGFLAAVLKPGMRAVSVGVTDVAGIAHLIMPGDRVDLLLTQTLVPVPGTEESGNQDRKGAETVLENIRILAVDTVLDDVKEQAIDGKTVTIEVTPKQAEMITIAVEIGRIAFSLRGLENNGFDRSIVATSATMPSGDMPASADATDGADTGADDAPAADATDGATNVVVGGPEDLNEEMDKPWRGESYTLDSEVSRLIVPLNGNGHKVLVFHGTQAEQLMFK
jgi:pilus assembly protein CpaB